ncbi:hypothetical protein N7447_000215 [Penicillium robsamsonii]|uniref:uncharacterized protein n=1 Tax=Penicillium robsamsonii TaxID=1792511 RepID=UPI0025481BCF|nr:uncharacterized protein N7447_000215 [Penicillium robsamsonii]KAJ5834189.1 hypothetical protein N7447_000215 [Penicillium robsamsonii]
MVASQRRGWTFGTDFDSTFLKSSNPTCWRDFLFQSKKMPQALIAPAPTTSLTTPPAIVPGEVDKPELSELDSIDFAVLIPAAIDLLEVPTSPDPTLMLAMMISTAYLGL